MLDMRVLLHSESSDQLVYPHVKLARRWHPALPHTDGIYVAWSELCFTSVWVSTVCNCSTTSHRPLCRQPHVQITTARSQFQSNVSWGASNRWNRWKCQGRLFCFISLFIHFIVWLQTMPSCLLMHADSQLSPSCKLRCNIQKQVSFIGQEGEGESSLYFTQQHWSEIQQHKKVRKATEQISWTLLRHQIFFFCYFIDRCFIISKSSL